jgi:hypothetical protein
MAAGVRLPPEGGSLAGGKVSPKVQVKWKGGDNMADIIGIAGNPFDNIESLKNVKTVIKQGRCIKTKEV